MTDDAAQQLPALIRQLEALASKRLAAVPRSPAAATRATRLADHLRGHLRVRAASLEAPLLVLILGPTGAGKSTVFNTLAGRAVSPAGVLRPTTREAVVLAHPTDRDALLDGTLASLERGQFRIVEDGTIEPGLALVDAPDIDSIEHANRALADRLVEAADLCLFVTTATRYADLAAWSVLDRVRERGLPLIVVVNRMPALESDQREVLDDVRRLLAATDLGDELVWVAEGDIEPGGDALPADAIGPIASRIALLRGDRDARMALAARALAGSLAGLGGLLDQVADDVDHEAIDVEALRRTAAQAYGRQLDDLRAEVHGGSFLRDEALRHWQAYVGADQLTRFFSQGIGRLRGAIAAVLRPVAAPVSEVRTATIEDLLAVARSHAAEAARRTAAALADDPMLGDALATDPGLWGTTPGFDEFLRSRLDAWIEGIATEIAARGQPKRLLARGASIGVNALGTGVMLGTFIHTGGLTGAEVGVAAATAFLNQKLLSALFGEAAMAELVAHARARLDAALAETFDTERERFEWLLPPAGVLRELAVEFHAAAATVSTLPRDQRER